MSTKLFELRPNRSLLDPNFNGYKLSLEKNPVWKRDLPISVDRVLPNSDQYSYLHARLFGLHNHLFTDCYNDAVYFVDKNWGVKKVSLDSITGRLAEIQKVWQIPVKHERNSGNYNISLTFPNENMAVLSDGAGTLYILDAKNRSDNQIWQSVFDDQVLEPSHSFIIQDAVLKTVENGNTELHCLLSNVERGEGDKFITIINWITLTQSSDLKWGQVSLRVLKGTGGLHYCALAPNCQFINLASDVSFKFTLDSENAIIEKPEQQPKIKTYTWTQTSDDITIRFNARSDSNATDFSVNTTATNIQIKYKDIILLEGSLQHRVDSDLTTYSVTQAGILEILLSKTENGLKWENLIPGNDFGEQLLDPSTVAEVHERLAHLCSDTEILTTETGPSFSSQQIEECDFVGDNTAIYERICCKTHEVTHRANLGSHQVIMSVKLAANVPNSLVIRHDVDGIIWTPEEPPNDHCLKHEGTLLAFGYVQASKQQRKFTSCSPDLSYSVICESTRHAFIYWQCKAVTSGELRNRRSGRLLGSVAVQQVVSLEDEEILGLSATNDALFLLTEYQMIVIKVTEQADEAF